MSQCVAFGSEISILFDCTDMQKLCAELRIILSVIPDVINLDRCHLLHRMLLLSAFHGLDTLLLTRSVFLANQGLSHS